MYTVGLDELNLFLILYFLSFFNLFSYKYAMLLLSRLAQPSFSTNGCFNNKLGFRKGPTSHFPCIRELLFHRGISSLKNEGSSKDTNLIREIIFGSVLGDGKLEIPPRGINARFGFTQSSHKKDYFIFIFNYLSSITSAKYREYSHVDKRTGKTYTSLNFWSKALPMLTEFYNIFYVDGIKIVPYDLSLLTPVALAHWIMQDGSRGSSRGLYICTDSFNEIEVNRLKIYIIERYQIRCTVHKVNGKFRLYILAKYVKTVRDLVLPHMHDSLHYLVCWEKINTTVQIANFSTNYKPSHKRSFSTVIRPKLDPSFVTGYSDGEASFSISLVKRSVSRSKEN